MQEFTYINHIINKRRAYFDTRKRVDGLGRRKLSCGGDKRGKERTGDINLYKIYTRIYYI